MNEVVEALHQLQNTLALFFSIYLGVNFIHTLAIIEAVKEIKKLISKGAKDDNP